MKLLTSCRICGHHKDTSLFPVQEIFLPTVNIKASAQEVVFYQTDGNFNETLSDYESTEAAKVSNYAAPHLVDLVTTVTTAQS